MSNSHQLLKSKVNHEYFAEVNRPKDPIQQLQSQSKTIQETISNIDLHFQLLKKRYPEYVDFYYKFNYTTPTNGCYAAWFDLYGIKE